MLEVIPGPQWTTAFGSIYIRTANLLWAPSDVRAIGIDIGIPTIFSDNTGTIQVSKGPAQHWKLKHIDTKYHFIRDNVQDGKVKIKYINTADNLADVFTKPVGKDALQRAQQGLGLKTQQAAAAQ
ncbi:uncharacterized protein UDID_17791 [Ustilago sp. UG-2017a]|nr:uncharacterized protein UDID_17791 [Ustilago sp. UG-2017a]